MLLADLVPGSFVTNSESQQTFTLIMTGSQVREKFSWITTNRDASSTPEIMMPRENANVSNFSDMQKHAYVKAHSEQPCHTNPLLLIIAGISGTGKSYLSTAIKNLQISCA